MIRDPLARLPGAFGGLLERLCRERKWDADTLANASHLGVQEIRSYEAGNGIPSLPDFFRLAHALGESPIILLAELISAWRSDPSDVGFYASRPSDFVRLYRLGYYPEPGEFCELAPVYASVDFATLDARLINTKRVKKGQ